MNNVTQRRHLKRTAALAVGALASLLAVAAGGLTAQADGLQAEERKYAITIDATAIVSQSWWHVPGVTPSIWTSDPETSDAYRTTEPWLLQLQPGRYKFISFTFDFPFEVTPAGMVEYASSLNQCVEGRGTSTLIVRCKRTYPYGGTPEYSLTP